jgi:hypothetical protein
MSHQTNAINHAAAPGAHQPNLPNHTDVNMADTSETNPIHHAADSKFAFWRQIVSEHNVAEAVVNGFWFQVLQHYFPAPEFMILPEKRLQNTNDSSFRADLIVLQVKHVRGVNGQPDQYVKRPVFAFEGKRGGLSPLEFDNCLPQLAGYIKHCAPLGTHRYGMLASGPNCIIMASTGNDNHQQINMVRFSSNAAVVNTGPERTRLDVTNGMQMGKVSDILEYLRAEANKVGTGYNRDWTTVEWNV